MVLEDQDIAEAAVFLKIDDPVAIGPEDVLDLARRKVAKRLTVLGEFR